MTDTQVLYPKETASTKPSRLPFLREVLIRSLQDAGLSSDEAWRLADDMRRELQDTPEIASHKLEVRVAARLRREYGEAVAVRYRNRTTPSSPVMVRDTRGRSAPFSRGRHRHYLESCGLSLEEAAAVTGAVYEHLSRKGVASIDSSYLARLTYRYLQRRLGHATARRYAVWVDFMRSDRPLLLLIMGVSGCGKSTVATEVAIRLGIVRTQSTDMLREVMRMMIPERLAPALHTSSFKAWEVLPAYERHHSEPDQAITDGYLAQAEYLAVACEAVLNRALRERVSLILEGIHVHPALLGRLPPQTDAIVIPILLAVLAPDDLRARFNRRGEQAPDRRVERYLSHFDIIWQLQTFLLAQADRWQVPIVPNDEIERTVQEVMRVIIDQLAQHFSDHPGRSFLPARSQPQES